MTQAIKKIVVPVEIDAACLVFAKQAAELARQHGAEMHLLHVADINACRLASFPWLVSPKVFSEVEKQRSSLLNTWKRWIENEYGIKVVATVDCGRKYKTILRYAASIKADLITIQQEANPKKWFGFGLTGVEYVIRKSQCQVITFCSDTKTMAEWRQVVIPVTDFIPEARINTIIDMARILKLKIHLLTYSSNLLENRATDFYLLTETLKRIKPSVNVQVECKCLEGGRRPVTAFLNYAKRVGADILMTNMKLT